MDKEGKEMSTMYGYAKIKPAAEYAGVSERTFRGWLKQGLKHARLKSGTILIKYFWIDEWIEQFIDTNNRVNQIVDDVIKDL